MQKNILKLSEILLELNAVQMARSLSEWRQNQLLMLFQVLLQTEDGRYRVANSEQLLLLSLPTWHSFYSSDALSEQRVRQWLLCRKTERLGTPSRFKAGLNLLCISHVHYSSPGKKLSSFCLEKTVNFQCHLKTEGLSHSAKPCHNDHVKIL